MIEWILAHLLGDWLFQPIKMAIGKGKLTFVGWLWCFLHVSIYTFMFILLVPNQSWIFYLSVFIPHFFIDKFSLIAFWQNFRDGFFWWDNYKKEPTNFDERVQSAFGGFRYAVEDNTVHLVCLYLSKVFFYV